MSQAWAVPGPSRVREHRCALAGAVVCARCSGPSGDAGDPTAEAARGLWVG